MFFSVIRCYPSLIFAGMAKRLHIEWYPVKGSMLTGSSLAFKYQSMEMTNTLAYYIIKFTSFEKCYVVHNPEVNLEDICKLGLFRLLKKMFNNTKWPSLKKCLKIITPKSW